MKRRLRASLFALAATIAVLLLAIGPEATVTTNTKITGIEPTGGGTYTGTANQVVVTGTVLSLPQDIATTSTPQFARLGLGSAADAQSPFSTTETWNNAGTVFTHWKAVITDTASASGSLAVSIKGGAAGATTLFQVDKNGSGQFLGNTTTSGCWGSSGKWYLCGSADGRINIYNSGLTNAIQDVVGPDVTVSTCGTGTVTAGSKNMGGNITATGATACTVVFSTQTFTNKPFCIVSPETGTIPTLIVNTTVSFTVTGLTSGAKFNYLCRGSL